ncbi:hypothetical protein [Pseudoroseomonas ludipueritiae]|uniref:Uncharacterized protein n=1 Tax=Pseudoroseomonas ludipueritiae TaxID=198093 RepID=A0ABR7RA62_9PROT|nr:hypothetical protein [Pseudoroseomonas ludipueritiae]MBC9178566.1 hypothetical protein [Pseudoroseomonas ludipueritiae]MCG7363196.1 hypothetical protein [Roseomonas sp. ACRSG]
MRPQGRLARDLGRFYRAQGERLLLRRPLTETPAEPNAIWGEQPWGQFPWDGRQPFHDLRCWGVVLGAEPVQLPSGVWQIRRIVRISNAEIAGKNWPGPPRRDDWLQRRADGSQYSVLDCDTRGLRGVAAVHILTVLGGS